MAPKLRAMKERSQIDEMRAAIRGDLERFRARQRANGVEEPDPEQVFEPEPEPEEASQPRSEQMPEPEPVEEQEPEQVSEPRSDQILEPQPVEEEGEDKPRASLFASIFRRR